MQYSDNYNKPQYLPVDAHERCDGSPDAESSDAGDHHERLAVHERRVNRLLYINGALLFASFIFFFSHWLKSVPLSKHKCAKLLSPSSPLLDSVEFWEGDFTNYFNHSTKFRGPPTEERENAWLELWDQPPIGVNDAIVRSLNKTESKHVEIIGSDPEQPTYAAMIEVFHQLHCLNLVRQATWPLSQFHESWGRKTFPHDLKNPLAGRMHIDHCIETLRLSLMCYGDVTPVLLDHTTGHRVPRILDFNVHHKCRNFDKIIDYAQENMVTVEDVGDGI